MRTPNRCKSLVFSSAFITAGQAFFLPALRAQESSDGPRLEEVIVTAQKRAESLQDVPLSVSAVSAEKIEQAGIENLEDLTYHIPNIHFTETGFSTQVRVRGIGSDNSQGFEQSVGMYVDGIYYGRAQLFRAPMMDMERAELLRGPQSTLFGKNSIAGALNLTTARPSDEFQGKVSYGYEFENAQKELNGMVSGPLTETLRARLAIRDYEEDGYMYNSYKDAHEPNSEESTYRLSLEWDAADALDLYFKAEKNEFSTIGRPIEITLDEPLAPNGVTYAQALAAVGQPALEANQDYRRQFDQKETSDNEINNYTFIADYDFGNYTLTAVSGWLDFNYAENCDCDDTASEILELALGEDYSQFSQELRINSAGGDTIDWIGGLFYQEWDQTFYDELSIRPSNLLNSAIRPTLSDTGLKRDFDQSSEAWSIFGQATWHINERTHLTLGARYTEEEKQAHKELNIFTPSTGALLNDPLVALLYLSVFRTETEQATVGLAPGTPPTPVALEYAGHDVSKSRDETAFTPLINLEYDLFDDVMVYASYTTGFKAGGFDPRSNSVGNLASVPGTFTSEPNPFLSFEFEEERAKAFELGMKSRYGGGRGELNLALYRTTYEDLQISQFDGAVGFNVGNAKDTLVQGIELDGRWALTQDLTAAYGASFLDFEYKDFRNGNCYAGQTPDGASLDGDDIPDTCDYTGKRGVYTPELTFNSSLEYHRPITGDIEFTGFIDAQYVSGHNVHVNLDPKGEIDPYTLVSMRLALETERWSLALLGKNLLDEYIISYSGDAPLSQSRFNTRTFYSVVRRPRTLTLEGTLRF